jgi:hypothetical protein
MEQLHNIIVKQMTWSNRTFGQGARSVGIARHIIKELGDLSHAEEAENNDECRAEVVDIAILAIDGLWRSTATGVAIGGIADTVQRDIIEELLFGYQSSLTGPYDPEDDCKVIIDTLGEPQADNADEFEATIYFRDIACWALSWLTCDIGLPKTLDLIQAKQAINAARQWPAPGGQDEPVEHVREAENVQ